MCVLSSGRHIGCARGEVRGFEWLCSWAHGKYSPLKSIAVDLHKKLGNIEHVVKLFGGERCGLLVNVL